MKKLFLIILIAVICNINIAFSQDNSDLSPTSKGKWLIETNTGFGGGGGVFGHSANTGFGLTSFNGETIWSIGGEAGYFVIDNLAVKFGLGYTDLESDKFYTYKLGAKYYLIDNIPIQIDITGGKLSGADTNPLWLGLQSGYAWFVGGNVSIEPGVRYNVSLNNDFTDKGIFEFRVGFALHF